MLAESLPILSDAERRSVDELTCRIIGSAQKVSSDLGPGFLEKVYENALAIVLQAEGCLVEQQRPLDVYHRGRRVGHYVADLVVDCRVLVELKAQECLSSADRLQCVNYLKASGFRVGLVINFGRRRLEWRRVVNRF